MPLRPITNPAPETDKPPRRRRRIPVALRLFVALLGLFGVGSAIWIGARVYRHKMAIREIQHVGGTVDLKIDAPAWLRDRVEDSWLTIFEKIGRIDLLFSENLDAKLPHLLAMRPFPELYVYEGPSIRNLIRSGRLDEARSLLLKHRILLFSHEWDYGNTWTPLQAAVCLGDFDLPQRVDFVKFILKQGAEINAHIEDECGPLSMAKHPAIVRLLLEHGASVAPTGPNRRVVRGTAARYARAEGEDQKKWLEVIRLLRAGGAEYDILAACWLDDVAHVRQLLSEGESGPVEEALLVAAGRGQLQIVKVLLEHGVDDFPWATHSAINHDHTDVLELLFASGTDPKSTYDRGEVPGSTFLHYAAGCGAVESARLLIGRGVPVNVRDSKGRTPLHVAAAKGNIASVRFLLDHQADPGALTNDGVTAISLAAAEIEIRREPKNSPNADLENVIELLLAAGEPPDLFTAIALSRTSDVRELLAKAPEQTNSRDCQGTSPLNRAVNLGHAEIVVALLEAGANINEADSTDDMPLHIAVDLRHQEIAKILIAHGADVNAVRRYGDVALHDAASQLEPEMVRLLLSAGANPNATGSIRRTPLDYARRREENATTDADQRKAAEIIGLLDEFAQKSSR